MWSQRNLRWAIEVLGFERIMLSTEYPHRVSRDRGRSVSSRRPTSAKNIRLHKLTHTNRRPLVRVVIANRRRGDFTRCRLLVRAEAASYFTHLLPIVFSGVEYDGIDAHDRPKHWHVFRFILRKPSRPAPTQA